MEKEPAQLLTQHAQSKFTIYWVQQMVSMFAIYWVTWSQFTHYVNHGKIVNLPKEFACNLPEPLIQRKLCDLLSGLIAVYWAQQMVSMFVVYWVMWSQFTHWVNHEEIWNFPKECDCNLLEPLVQRELCGLLSGLIVVYWKCAWVANLKKT